MAVANLIFIKEENPLWVNENRHEQRKTCHIESEML